MESKLQCLGLTLVEATEGSAVGALQAYITVPVSMTIVSVAAAPSADDAGLTIDINDDGTGVITALSAAVKATPGTWKATGYGGTNAPVVVAAGSDLSIDVNNAAAGTVVFMQIWYLTGELVTA